MVEHKDAFGSVYIPEDWSLIQLGKCVTEKLSYGINAPAIPFDGKSPAYIRITDITEDGRFDDSDRKAVKTNEREKYMLREGDIVLARTGASTGKTYLYDKRDGELVYAGFLIKASIDINQHNPRFIVGQLRSPRYWSWVAAMSMRSGQPGINGKEYSSFLVPVAPKEEQDAIANALAEFDTHIANLAELIEKKKAIRDGALEDLLSGRTRLAGFTHEWKNSTLGKEYQVVMGQSPTSASYNDSRVGVPLVQGNADIADGVTAPQRYTSAPTKICNTGATIVSVRAPVGSVSRANQAVCLGRGVCAIDGKEQNFIFYLMRYCEKFWQALEQGSTFTAVGGKEVRAFEIRIPSEEKEQKAIADVLMSMDDEINALEDERNKMIQIREGAMDDLLTGRVRLTV